MIMMLVMVSIFLCVPFTPMKVSLTLTLWSVLAALTCLNWGESWIFLISAMVINFSSAMMMVFCFCSMLSNFESSYKKNSPMKWMIMGLSFLCVIINYDAPYKLSMNKNLILFNEWWFTLMCFIILLCMLGINYSMIMPKKKMIEMY